MILLFRFITDFGDSAVVGTLTVVLALAFFATRNRHAMVAILLAFGIAAAIIAAVKIAFYGCWLSSPVAGLRSPSGHTAISAAVYGALVVIAAAPLRAQYRYPAYLLTAAFVILIAATRVMLGEHTVADVICGLLIGAGVCMLVWRFCLRRKPPIVNRELFLIIALAALILAHGIRLPAEALIDTIAAHLAHSGCIRSSRHILGND